MIPEGQARQKLPFAEEKESKQFMKEVILLLIKEVDNRRKEFGSTENFLVFYHGKGWNYQREDKDGYKPRAGEMHLVSTGCQVAIDRILVNDMTIISDFIRKTADGMTGQIVQQLLGEITAVSKETGNTISIPKAGSLADAYLQMIKTTEAMVDHDGRVSLPTLHPPELAKKLECELAQRGPEFHKEIETARKEKEQQALAREAERLARYDSSE
jgi:hypothetical protein